MIHSTSVDCTANRQGQTAYELLRPLCFVFSNYPLGHSRDLGLYRLSLVDPGMFASASRGWVIIAKLEDLSVQDQKDSLRQPASTVHPPHEWPRVTKRLGRTEYPPLR